MYSPLCLSLCSLTLSFGLALSRDTRRRCLGSPHQPLPSLTPLPLERSAHLSRGPVQPVRCPQSSLRSGHGQHRLRAPELLGANPQSPRRRRAGKGHSHSPSETRRWRQLVAAARGGPCRQAFWCRIREWEEQEEEQKSEEGTVEADSPGEGRGQKRIASAHCCLAGCGAAPSTASQCVPESRLPAT